MRGFERRKAGLETYVIITLTYWIRKTNYSDRTQVAISSRLFHYGGPI